MFDLNCRLLKMQVGIKKFVYQDMRWSTAAYNTLFTIISYYKYDLKSFMTLELCTSGH